jgi:hypothetical protein
MLLALHSCDRYSNVTKQGEARHQKEEEMKLLERGLIEVLIEQQKKLLTILSDAAEHEAALDPVLERLGHANTSGNDHSGSSGHKAGSAQQRARAVPKAVMFNTLGRV